MPQYRIYHLDGTGRVTAAEWLEAAGDEAAIDATRGENASVQCEVWQGRRLVTRIANGAPIALQPVPPGDNRSAATR
jgi:hypothetical protein